MWVVWLSPGAVSTFPKQVTPVKGLQVILWFPRILLAALLLVGCSLLNDCPAPLTPPGSCVSSQSNSSHPLYSSWKTFLCPVLFYFPFPSAPWFFSL